MKDVEVRCTACGEYFETEAEEGSPGDPVFVECPNCGALREHEITDSYE